MQNSLAVNDSNSMDTIARTSTLVAHHRLLNTITKHADYVGEDGKPSTSKTGFAIQINRKIKQVFGRPIEELTSEYDLETLMAIRINVDRKIKAGERDNLSRSKIKKIIYKTIEDTYALFN